MQKKKIHYLTGITLTVFIGFHLINHLIGLFGVEKHIEWMDIMRTFYRNPIIESLLMLAVIAQIVTGIQLFRQKRKRANVFFEKLQIWSGLYLAFFLLIHVSAVITGRYVLELDTNIYFGAAGLNIFPLNLFFIPYYALAICSFFGHIAAIHSQKMKQSIFGFTPHQQSKIILIKGIVITLIIFYALTNGFSGLDIPIEYRF